MNTRIDSLEVTIEAEVELRGQLSIPEAACGIVLFVHGSGSSRFSPRNRLVAEVLNRAGLATLLFDLLTADEEKIDAITRELRFDIGLLASRLNGAIHWITANTRTRELPAGLFGASTGAAAALIAAAQNPDTIRAVVSRGGRPDLAGKYLAEVQTPCLFVVGGLDTQVIQLNRAAAGQMPVQPEIRIVDGATHLFEEPGTLEQVAALSRDWLLERLANQPSAATMPGNR
jgi:dienelactone hydrolase